MIVAKDGTGSFTTIQEAIDSITGTNQERITIYIKDGIYKEKLEIHRPNISLVGTHRNKVKIVYDDYAKKEFPNGEKMGTFWSYSTIITGDGFYAKNITFENNAGCGSVVGQALAAYVDADRVEFHHCSFLGSQDTLFTGPLPPKPIETNRFGGPRDEKEKRIGRSYFSHCYIEGDIDFIFGSATSVFQSCEIHSLNRHKEINGYITAASTPYGEAYGYVFLDCFLTSYAKPRSVYLGRPWRDYAKTVFLRCWMDEHIKETGWHDWEKPLARENAYYAEFQSHGPGAIMDKRAAWSHILTEEEAKTYTIETIFGSLNDWPTLGRLETEAVHIYLAGDSTMEKVKTDQGNKRGWGEFLDPFFIDSVRIMNEARGGRSSKSFINEGHLNLILKRIMPGDYLFIQFGHNDQKVDEERATDPYSSYQEYLSVFIEGAKEKGAIPVLLTSVNRRTFDEEGNFVNSLGSYPDAVRQLGDQLMVPVIDLWEKSKSLFENLGPDETKKLFAWYTMTNPSHPIDETHFSSYGAEKIAELVAEGIEESGLPLSKYLIKKHV